LAAECLLESLFNGIVDADTATVTAAAAAAATATSSSRPQQKLKFASHLAAGVGRP